MDGIPKAKRASKSRTLPLEKDAQPDWRKVVEERAKQSFHFNQPKTTPSAAGLLESTPRSLLDGVVTPTSQTPPEVRANKTKPPNSHCPNFTLPWEKLLPAEVQELIMKSGFSPEFCQQNIRPILYAGVFLKRDAFPKEMWPIADKSSFYCDPERIKAAQSLIQLPSKPIKKLLKSQKHIGVGGFGSVYAAKTKFLPKIEEDSPRLFGGSSSSRCKEKSATHSRSNSFSGRLPLTHASREKRASREKAEDARHNLGESPPRGKKKQIKMVAIKKLSHNTNVHKVRNLDEIGFLATLDHPNIVTLYYALVISSHECAELTPKTEIWIVTEFLRGGTLADASGWAKWTQPAIAFVAQHVLFALQYLHAQKIGHRDLKSSNVMLSVEGEIKLIDFGLCCDFSREGHRTQMLGTSHWIPPEMIMHEPHNWMVDIWSLGVCILELYLLHPPHHTNTFKSMVCAATTGLHDQIPQDHPQLNKYGQKFLQDCLTVDPKKRKTADELLGHRWIEREALKSKTPMARLISEIFQAQSLALSGLI